MGMWQKIFKTDFSKNVFQLSSGIAIAQAIPILISPILTRFYSPEDFGLFSLYLSVLTTLEVISTGRYEMAIVLPKHNGRARNIAQICILVALSLFGILVLANLIGHRWFAHLMNNPKVAPWLYLIPLSVLFTGVYQSFYFWNSRQKTFKVNAYSKVVRALGIASVQLLLGLKSLYYGLILGNFTGVIASTIFITKRTPLLRKNFWKGFRWNLTKKVAHRYKDFPTINSFHAFSDMIRNNGVIFIFAAIYDSGALGLFGLTTRALRIPVMLISSSVSNVLYQELSEQHNNGYSIRKAVGKVLKKLLLVGFPIFATVFAFGPWAFSLVFGREWQGAGEMARILSPWLFFIFISSPLSCIPLVMEKQKVFFGIGLFGNALSLLSFWLGSVFFHDLMHNLIFFSAVMSTYLFGLVFWFLKISK